MGDADLEVRLAQPNIRRVSWFHFIGEEPEDASWWLLKDWVLSSGIEYARRRFVGFDNPHPMVADPHGYETQMILDDSEGDDGRFLGAPTKEYSTEGLYITVTVPITQMGKAWDAIFAFVKENGYSIDTENRQYFEEHIFPTAWWAIPKGDPDTVAADIGFRIWMPVARH